jgi:outer membrane protein assembly factor BamB
MKKTVLILVSIVFCMLGSCTALGSEAPENLMTYDMPETGFLPGAAKTADGLLLTGIPLDKGTPWVVLLDENGAEQWFFSEPAKDVRQYLCPALLDDGTYAVVRQTNRGEFDYDCDRLILDENGKLLSEMPLWHVTNWTIPDAEETISVGSFDYNGNYLPMVARQDGKGEDIFAYYYPVEGCTSADFEKGVLTEDSLIIGGRGIDAQFGQSAGLLYRIDPEGKVVWAKASTADYSYEFVYTNDVCVTADGLIIWIFTTVRGEEDDAYPVERESTVYCFNMDGDTMWTYKTSNNDMLDYVVPVSGGFLFGSEGLELEECPYLGQGWLLFLTRDGQENPEMDLPQLGDGSMELLGMTADTEDSVVCYGLMLEDVGYPGKPFFFDLSFPPASE